MKEPKYRISERNGRFNIQVYVGRTTGMFWWKKKVWGWESIGVDGYADQVDMYHEPEFSNTFKSIKKARKQIVLWLEKTKYHNYP